MDGRLIAAAGAVPDDAPVTSIQEIRCGPGKAAIGRVVGRGDGSIVEAVVASLTNALAALAGTTHEHHPGGSAAHRLEAEMALSRRIQRSLIPLTPPELRGFEVATYYEAAREVGGDFFDVFPLRDRAGRAGIVIADVTGKGIAAALLMAFARPLILGDRSGRDPSVRSRDELDPRPGAAVRPVHHGARGGPRPADPRPPAGNAGHEPPLIVPRRPPDQLADRVRPLIGAFPSLDPCPAS
jgi:hypothetical protein